MRLPQWLGVGMRLESVVDRREILKGYPPATHAVASDERRPGRVYVGGPTGEGMLQPMGQRKELAQAARKRGESARGRLVISG